jgi:hypothetical protein
MKLEDILILAGVSCALFWIAKKAKAKSVPATVSQVNPASYATLITESDGWKYYTDGTSIGPDGTYYKGGDMVYDPQGMYRSAF